ncbi:hypothetical protein AVEN_17258-1 [Araneus ventricosus]|uniref:Uncharacterized protein n=1 Tax=Araneus ventricosus TaxID=182803 RepID=A0A4Y2LX73_ARAVE|nr:hypothetical protein AVEN_17258-1 [Araneus ventricosus]
MILKQYFPPLSSAKLSDTFTVCRQENSVRQVVWLRAVAIATGYITEDPFQIGGIRQKSEFFFKFLAHLIRLLGFAAVARSFSFGDKCANVTNLNERLPTRNGFLLR